jgi:hypothetical protein
MLGAPGGFTGSWYCRLFQPRSQLARCAHQGTKYVSNSYLPAPFATFAGSYFRMRRQKVPSAAQVTTPPPYHAQPPSVRNEFLCRQAANGGLSKVRIRVHSPPTWSQWKMLHAFPVSSHRVTSIRTFWADELPVAPRPIPMTMAAKMGEHPRKRRRIIMTTASSSTRIGYPSERRNTIRHPRMRWFPHRRLDRCFGVSRRRHGRRQPLRSALFGRQSCVQTIASAKMIGRRRYYAASNGQLASGTFCRRAKPPIALGSMQLFGGYSRGPMHRTQ